VAGRALAGQRLTATARGIRRVSGADQRLVVLWRAGLRSTKRSRSATPTRSTVAAGSRALRQGQPPSRGAGWVLRSVTRGMTREAPLIARVRGRYERVAFGVRVG